MTMTAILRSPALGILLSMLLAPAAVAVADFGNPQAVVGLNNPFGITTDLSGNLLVIWDKPDPNPFASSQVLGLYSPQGQTLKAIAVGDWTTTYNSRLATLPSTGDFLQLWQDGLVQVLDAGLTRAIRLTSLREAPLDASAVFDVALGQVSNLSSLLFLSRAEYTDVGVLERSVASGAVQRDIFVTGFAVTYPFVIRIRLLDSPAGATITYKLMAASTAIPGSNQSTNFTTSARGVAVNPQGMVLTSLPVPLQAPSGIAVYDVPVAFSADYPEGRGPGPQLPLGTTDLYSRGMAVDPAGNFFVATGRVGTSDCGGSAILKIDAQLRSRTCITGSNDLFVDVRDLALSPDGNSLYVLIGEPSPKGGVIRFTRGPAPTSPVITIHPQSQTVTVGGTVTFTVLATGTPPLSYQWRWDGQPLAGQTGSVLTLANVQASAAGSYTVVVSNSAGQATSNPAVLTVNPAAQAPAITTHPQSRTVTVGETVTFTVLATGTAPLSYQWRKDGQPLAGQTGSALTLANVQASAAGSYTVVVSNSAGQVTSNPAVLTVTLGPTLRHPADVNPPDHRLTLQEVIAYAAAYKRGQAWSEGPNPIPLDYMVRAATLYLRGETYRHDPAVGPPPLDWVNVLGP